MRMVCVGIRLGEGEGVLIRRLTFALLLLLIDGVVVLGVEDGFGICDPVLGLDLTTEGLFCVSALFLEYVVVDDVRLAALAADRMDGLIDALDDCAIGRLPPGYLLFGLPLCAGERPLRTVVGVVLAADIVVFKLPARRGGMTAFGGVR